MTDLYQETINFLNNKTNNFKPEIAIILGSGLSSFCKNINGITIKYNEIPNFAYSNVIGHKGELLFCEIENKKVIIMQGRFHYYEGNSLQSATYPIKIFKKLGVKTLIITNAAGAAHKELNIGDIMLIEDHINFMGNNPLIGKNDDTLGDRFPDMSDCYNKNLQELSLNCAKELNLNIKKGVYLATTGPSYETPSEVKAFRLLGADVIGMSTVPEAIVGNYLKMNIIGFSLITNYATGVSDNKLTHNEVLETGKQSAEKLVNLLKKIISKLD